MATSGTAPNSPLSAPIVVKLGRQSAKKIKQLGEGRGPLFDKLMIALSDMQKTGTVDSKSQPVIVVVKQRRKKMGLGLLG